jgi:hypothetical protein
MKKSEPAPYAAMKWLLPLGKLFQGDIFGTKDFPAMQPPEKIYYQDK